MRNQKGIIWVRIHPETLLTGCEVIKTDLLRDHQDAELSECEAISETHLGRVDGLVSRDESKR